MSFTLQSRRHIVVERVNTFVFLGLWIQNDLKWNTDISKITKRTNKLFTLIRECRKSSLYATSEFGLLTYTTNTATTRICASPVWDGIPKYLEEEIEKGATEMSLS